MGGKMLTQVECDWIREMSDAGATDKVICATAEISSSTLHKLMKRDWRALTKDKREIPDDWAEVAPGKSTEELRKHYRTGWRVVDRWRKSAPMLRPKIGNKPLPVPSDIGEVMKLGNTYFIAAHYGVSRATATKWRDEERKRQAAAERQRLAALTSFERQMEQLRGGAALVAKYPMRRPDPAYTLGGIATGAL